MVTALFSTIGTLQDATRVATTLVQEHLVACVNIIPTVHSIYRWHGKIEHAEECALLAKTRDDKAAAAMERLRALHPYDLPEILLFPVPGGLAEYLSFVNDESL